MTDVSLRRIDADTVRTICRLAVRPEQERFVAPNAVSLAEANFHDEAWYRAVYSGDEPVGFVMLSDKPVMPEYFLWRFMIDARHQGRGFGREAIRLVVDHVRQRPGATELLTSVVEGEGGPLRFYEGLGFRLTGEYEDDEAVLRLPLEPAAAGAPPDASPSAEP